MSQALVKTTINDSVLTISLDRLDKKNALSAQMYNELTAAYKLLEDDDSLKVAVVQGDEKCFCAGNDLKDFLESGEFVDGHPTIEFLKQMHQMTKPIVAAVAGPAVGIGTTMLLHCDLIYAANNSIFALPFSQLGLCPEASSSYLLPQLVGHHKAFELMVLGERMDAQTAKEIGLVAKVVEPEELLELAHKKANVLASLPQESVIKSKALLNATKKPILENVLKAELIEFANLLKTDECQTILHNFFKK